MEGLPQLLKAWATQEMKFQNVAYSSSDFIPLPTEKDFEQLCKKPLDDVWRYVLKHVKSKQSVREIKGNIELYKRLGLQKSVKTQQTSQETSEQNALQQAKAELVRELTSCRSDVHQLHKEMNHLKHEVMDAELAYQSARQRVRDLQKKEVILEVAGKCAEETVARYSEYDQRVEKLYQNMTRQCEGHKNNYVTRGIKNKVGDLETECCRDVRLACEVIEEFLHRIIDGSFGDKTTLENAQKQLAEKIEAVASAHNISSLVSALVTNINYTSKELQERTQQISIAKDAEALSFSYDAKDGLRDMSSPPSVQKSVQELLLAGNEQHVMRWFHEQEKINEQWKLTAQLDDIMMDIRKQVQRLIGDQPRCVQLANSYIDAQIQLAEERSVLPCLKAEACSLKNKIAKAKQERQELHLKYEKIQDFRGLVEKKQNIISTLARQNAQAPVKLDSQKKQVMSYILSRSMSSHAAQVHRLTDGLKNSFISELMKFDSLDISCFVTVSLDSNTRQCVLDLSIAPSIHPLAHEKLHMYTDIRTAVGFPAFKSTDSLFLHVLDIHNQIQELHQAQQRRQNSVRTAMTAANTTDDLSTFLASVQRNLEDMCQKAKEHDRAQCDKLLPKLQKSLKAILTCASQMSDLQKQVNIWWEQPAQFTTPWVVTEGMTFDQWLRKWRVAVTMHHKKMIEYKCAAMKQQDSASKS
ncbi:unnamed protein product [Candidula unifasciata]|uniref:HAUS augmin-like complex subunit 5 n=1 Tax=Candidula unifasciata TaxID=100452 RepID=A0A8S4A4V8_9EUPU|nr:unnamed protein product [Candidula unifasciata]